jgi:cytochrome c553
MKSFLANVLRVSFLFLLFATHSALAQQPHAGRSLAANCFTCHGMNGNSSGNVPPSLAGRNAAELFQTMKDFQSGNRPATIMQQQAKGYTDEQLRLIAAYFANQKPQTPATPAQAR